MKKLIYSLLALPMLLLGSCKEELGTEPGTDSNPVVTLYAYEPTDASLNPDNDVIVRFVANNKVTSVKYLLLPSADATAMLDKADGEKTLLNEVETKGTAVENLKADNFVDITLTDIHGDYTIAAVANGRTLANRVTFFGLDWNVVTTGTFIYNTEVAPIESVEATLEICTSDDALYRINGAFGNGTALKMDMLNLYGTDDDGKYRYFRVKPTATPWTYGDYGTVSVRDIGYWQGNAAFVTDNGYESGLYEDGNAFFYLQWYVAAGNLGYQYSYFVAD